MAAIFQPTYTKTLPDGRKVTRHSPTWWIEYMDPRLGRRVRVKGYRDKMATEIKAADLVRKAQRGDVGAVDPYEAMRKLPFSSHLEAYETHLRNKGDGSKHVRAAKSLVGAFFSAAQAVRLEDLKALDVDNVIRGLRDRDIGPKTRNEYLATLRGFFRWCVRTKRATPDTDPTLTLEKAPVQEDIRRERRALPPEELVRLLEATLTRPLAEARKEGRLLAPREVEALGPGGHGTRPGLQDGHPHGDPEGRAGQADLGQPGPGLPPPYPQGKGVHHQERPGGPPGRPG